MNNVTDFANHGELRILPQSELEGIGVGLEEVLQVVESALIGLRRPDSFNPLKTIVYPPDQRSISYSMVGRDGASNTVGFKVVYEFDPLRHNDTYQFHSFLFLCDDATGLPIALMDVVKLGPLRTSATAALMARAARPDARSALVVGTGVQGQNALPMLLAALPDLERLQVYGHYQAGLQAVCESVKRYDAAREVEIADDLRTAAAEADIVIGVAGASAKAEVRQAWLRPGTVAILAGYGINADVLHSADYRIATDAAQMQVTAGDLAGSDGQVPPINAELPDILLGKMPARHDERDIVFAYNSGMVVTDIALGRYLAQHALAKGRGQKVRLW